jgi:hypothetical protein
MKKSYLLLLVLPFILSSCDVTLEDLASAGTFDAAISGTSVNKSWDGTAAFAQVISTSSGAEGSILGIDLSNSSDPDDKITLTITDLGNITGIETGTYNYEIPGTGSSSIILSLIYETKDNLYSFPIVGLKNQIIITKTTDLRMEGSFEVNLTDDVLGTNSVKITGTFDAIGATKTN